MSDPVIARIDKFEVNVSLRLTAIEEQVRKNADDIAQAKGGIKVAKWIFATTTAVAGLFGFSHFMQK